MLRLVRDGDDSNSSDLQTCPRCEGKGWIPCPPTWGVRGNNPNAQQHGPFLQPSYGKPIPCTMCNGKKVV